MPIRPNGHRDSTALAFAAMATFVLSFVDAPVALNSQTAGDESAAETALEPLIDAGEARAAGAWWLDEQQPAVKLSFAPEYERLVWVVEGGEQRVLLDAKTGEALAFEFE